jgi:GINS complex subunit 1
VHYESLKRNKRCALAYLSHRADRCKQLWWQTGAVASTDARSKMSTHEQAFFEGYDALVGNVQGQ